MTQPRVGSRDHSRWWPSCFLTAENHQGHPQQGPAPHDTLASQPVVSGCPSHRWAPPSGAGTAVKPPQRGPSHLLSETLPTHRWVLRLQPIFNPCWQLCSDPGVQAPASQCGKSPALRPGRTGGQDATAGLLAHPDILAARLTCPRVRRPREPCPLPANVCWNLCSCS